MMGIYSYRDLKTDEIVYIGKDSNIDKKLRYYAHKTPARYHEQQINKVIQNNPERYQYEELCASNDCDKHLLKELEMGYIEIYKPKFNFTNGNESFSEYKPSVEDLEKRGYSHSKRNNKLGIYRVHVKHKKGMNKPIYVYQCKRDGKRFTIESVDLEKLKRKVLLNGLKWEEFT